MKKFFIEILAVKNFKFDFAIGSTMTVSGKFSIKR